MDNRIHALNTLLERYDIEKNPELSAMSEGRVDRAVAEALVEQYYPVNLQFPLFLAAAISHVPDEPTRQLLVQNLWEEHGSGEHKNSHTELFRRFIIALDLDPTCYQQASIGTPAAELISEYDSACRLGPARVALAFMFAFEKLFGPLSTSVARGFRLASKQVINESALEFFDVHGVADIEHAEKLQHAFLASVRTTEEWENGLNCVNLGAKLLTNIFSSAARRYRS